MSSTSRAGSEDTGHWLWSGDVAHLYLATNLHHIPDMLGHHPVLLALNGDREAVTAFLLDPSTDPCVINLVQQYGQGAGACTAPSVQGQSDLGVV